MTQFEEFKQNLPEWDGNDRVAELMRFVIADTELVTFKHKQLDCTTVWPRFLVKYCIDEGRANIVIQGEQGIGKSTFVRWLCPFIENKEPQMTFMQIGNSLLFETQSEILPEIKPDNCGTDIFICHIKFLQFKYTQIDLEQLYAQILLNK